MVRLEHINLVVSNIEKTKSLLLTAFPHWRVRGQGKGEWFGKERSWEHLGDDNYYITLNDNGDGKNRNLEGHSNGLAHVGFVVDHLDELQKRLEAKDFSPVIIGADHPHRKNLYFHDPEGFEFEFIEYLSDTPSEKNQYGGETSEIIRIAQ